MLTPRQRIILRQVVSPPYIYRWAGLLTTVTLVVGVAIVVLTDTQTPTVLATGAQSAVSGDGTSRPATRALEDAPARGLAGPARPAITPSLLTVTQTSTDAPTVALTFDDGPWPGSTHEVLDLLAQYGAPAVFCTIGEQAVAHPEIIRAIADRGHRLCDHTMTHDATAGDHPPDVIDRQMRASRDAITAAAGGTTQVDYFRAPEGRWSPALDQGAAREGMRPLGWSVDTLDWTQPGAPTIVATVQQHVHPGAVILFHDGGGPREQTVAALRDLLPWLQQQGYHFVLPT